MNVRLDQDQPSALFQGHAHLGHQAIHQWMLREVPWTNPRCQRHRLPTVEGEVDEESLHILQAFSRQEHFARPSLAAFAMPHNDGQHVVFPYDSGKYCVSH